MKRFVSILILWLGAHAAWAEDYSGCFTPGEVVEYKVSWAGIPLAWSKTTTDTITEEGRELIRIRMVAQTYGAYTHIYKVDDVTEVIVDPETALPLRLDLEINEGDRRKSHFTTFNHDEKVAIFQDRITKDIREVSIESGTRDILTFLYYNRNLDLESLAAEKHKLYVDGKIYDLGMKIRDKDDNVKLQHYGKINSIEIEPIAEFDGLFLRQGKITFWISKQNRRMVTCVEAKVMIGKVSVKLEDVSGPGDDFWITNKQ